MIALNSETCYAQLHWKQWPNYKPYKLHFYCLTVFWFEWNGILHRLDNFFLRDRYMRERSKSEFLLFTPLLFAIYIEMYSVAVLWWQYGTVLKKALETLIHVNLLQAKLNTSQKEKLDILHYHTVYCTSENYATDNRK